MTDHDENRAVGPEGRVFTDADGCNLYIEPIDMTGNRGVTITTCDDGVYVLPGDAEQLIAAIRRGCGLDTERDQAAAVALRAAADTIAALGDDPEEYEMRPGWDDAVKRLRAMASTEEAGTDEPGRELTLLETIAAAARRGDRLSAALVRVCTELDGIAADVAEWVDDYDKEAAEVLDAVRRIREAIQEPAPPLDTDNPLARLVEQQPRRFHLQRDRDATGVSGTGRVADGTLWPDGTASLRWRGERPSTVHWDRMADAEHVHGHGGATRIVWID